VFPNPHGADSVADEHHPTALRLGKSLQNSRCKRTQVVDAVASRNQNDYRNIESGDVLLLGKIAIYREKHVELGSSQSEQLAIPFAGPSHLGNGPRIVATNSRFRHLGRHPSRVALRRGSLRLQ
jgi:hypothetical protein